jgi:hypothetical protein
MENRTKGSPKPALVVEESTLFTIPSKLPREYGAITSTLANLLNSLKLRAHASTKLFNLAFKSSIGKVLSTRIFPEEYPYDAIAKLPPVGIADNKRGSRSCE